MGKPTVEMADKSFSSMNVLAPFDIKIAPLGKRGSIDRW